MFLLVIKADQDNFADNLVSVVDAIQQRNPKAPTAIKVSTREEALSPTDIYTHPDTVEVKYWSPNGAGKLVRHIPWDQIESVELYF